MKGRRESAVQAGILAYLSTRSDFFWWRNNSGAMRVGQSFVRFGVPGAPDILGVLAPDGVMVGIEVKREVGGTVSGDQVRWGENLTNHGGLYVVARSVDEVQVALGVEKARVLKVGPKRVYPR